MQNSKRARRAESGMLWGRLVHLVHLVQAIVIDGALESLMSIPLSVKRSRLAWSHGHRRVMGLQSLFRFFCFFHFFFWVFVSFVHTCLCALDHPPRVIPRLRRSVASCGVQSLLRLSFGMGCDSSANNFGVDKRLKAQASQSVQPACGDASQPAAGQMNACHPDFFHVATRCNASCNAMHMRCTRQRSSFSLRSMSTGAHFEPTSAWLPVFSSPFSPLPFFSSLRSPLFPSLSVIFLTALIPSSCCRFGAAHPHSSSGLSGKAPLWTERKLPEGLVHLVPMRPQGP